jgi:hypothetical protein
VFPKIFANIFLLLQKSLLLFAIGNVLRYCQLVPLQMFFTEQKVSVSGLIDFISFSIAS